MSTCGSVRVQMENGIASQQWHPREREALALHCSGRNVKNKYCYQHLYSFKVKKYGLLNRRKFVESKYLNKYLSYIREIFVSFT